MSEPSTLPRPRQVTVAAAMAVAASVLLVVGLFDRMGELASPETRHGIADFLGRPPGDGLGIDVAQVVRILHALVLVDGALAATAAVFAVFSLQRHSGARIGLSVAAGLLLFTAPLTGDLLSLLVAVAATMLWSAPARDWFAGRAPRPAAVEERRAEPASRPAAQAWAPPLAEERLDGPGHEPRDPATPHPDQPAPAAYPFGSAPARAGGPVPPVSPLAPAPDGRPSQVTTAAWIAWVFSGLTAAFSLLEMVTLVAARDQALRAMHKNAEVQRLVQQTQMSDRDLIALLWLVLAVALFWSLSAMVLAFLAYRRFGWARVALAVSCAIAGLLALTSFPFGLPHAVAAFLTIAMLFHRASNEWFAAGRPAGPSYDGRPPAQAPERPKPRKNVW